MVKGKSLFELLTPDEQASLLQKRFFDYSSGSGGTKFLGASLSKAYTPASQTIPRADQSQVATQQTSESSTPDPVKPAVEGTSAKIR